MQARDTDALRRAGEVFAAFTRLGLTSFGGPVAHVGYFRAEFVGRRGWLDDERFSGFVALANTLPGPSSSQVAMLIGSSRAGVLGAAAAWLAFTLPSAAIMTAFALGLATTAILKTSFVHGLLLAACAVVAAAILEMVRTLAPDPRRLTFAAACGAVLMLTPASSIAQLIVIVLGAVAGPWLAPDAGAKVSSGEEITTPAQTAAAPKAGRAALVFGLLFVALLGLSFAVPAATAIGEAARFYQAGSLVVGGGHVVLPLLQVRFVTPGGVSDDAFLAGYAAAQAMPGPLFSFSAYLGALASPVSGIGGAALGLLSIYLPSFLLLAAIAPVWEILRTDAPVRRALAGVNVAVIGLLIAALYRPLIVTTIHLWSDVVIVLLAFMALSALRWQPVFVVAGCALAAALLAR